MNDNKEKPTRRLLPQDYAKYRSLDNKTKFVQKPKGFFTIPERLKSKWKYFSRPFLCFYFENNEDFNLVKKEFELPSKSKSHPKLNTDLLVKLIKEYNDKKGT